MGNKLKQYSEVELKLELEKITKHLENIKRDKIKRKSQAKAEQLKKDIIEHPEKINKKLFYKKYGGIENVASTFLDSVVLYKYANINHLKKFKEFYNSNKKETINIMLFKVGLIDSDYMITKFNLKDILEKKAGKKYTLSESFDEIVRVLVKNNEIDLLKGIHNPAARNTNLYSSDNLSLPFQFSPEGISSYTQAFKFNYTIDCAKNQETKNELKEIRNKRVKELFFDLGLENTKRIIYNFLDIYNKHEVVLRKNGIVGNNLLEKIDDFDFVQKNFNKDLKKLEKSLYEVQFVQQGKILNFISKEAESYLELIGNLISNVGKEQHSFSGFDATLGSCGGYDFGGVGLSGSNGGPIGKLEKINNREYLKRLK